MKRLIAILMMTVLVAAALCACGEPEPKTKDTDKYPGTYVYENSTMREISTRTLTVKEDGTYTYVRVSSIEEKNGHFSGKWTVDQEGYIILTGDISGKTSRGLLSEDTLSLDIADLGHGEDTVGDGIYRYQFQQKSEATPDAG